MSSAHSAIFIHNSETNDLSVVAFGTAKSTNHCAAVERSFATGIGFPAEKWIDDGQHSSETCTNLSPEQCGGVLLLVSLTFSQFFVYSNKTPNYLAAASRGLPKLTKLQLERLTATNNQLWLLLLFIYYATKAAHDNTTYKTRKIIHNKKTTIKLQICSQRCRKRVCHCTFYTVSSCSRPDTVLTAH